MMNSAYKLATFIPNMGLLPVIRSKGRGGSMSFPNYTWECMVAVFIHPEHHIYPPSCHLACYNNISTLRIKLFEPPSRMS